ncbi:MAG: adenosylcobinamide-GDP ribazoletransferase [Lachnospiraceae bacterium]|nr:adenosylcobinamide-GDP ribazoletransferase [Lachnospiraceae bacterium]
MERFITKKIKCEYAIWLFPVIGFVVGVLLCGWSYVCTACGFSQICFAMVGAVIPVIVTGGIHMEGFVNTVHALHSRGKKEKKQELLKDSYVNAFAVLAAICFFLLYMAGLTLIWKENQLKLLGLCFIISRTLDGMSLVWFLPAKKEGMLNSYASMRHKGTVRVVLVVLLALEFAAAVLIHPLIGTVMALAAMWVWTYYYYMSKNQFGGITEELAGFFLGLCELSSVLVLGFLGRVM